MPCHTIQLFFSDCINCTCYIIAPFCVQLLKEISFSPPGKPTLLLPIMSINITSLKAKSLNSPFKRNLLWKEALMHNTDILCVQKTHFISHKPPACSHKQFQLCFFANSPSKKAGILIAICSSVSFKLLHSDADPNGRFLILNALLNDHTLTTANVYAPHTNQKQFYIMIMEKLASFR